MANPTAEQRRKLLKRRSKSQALTKREQFAAAAMQALIAKAPATWEDAAKTPMVWNVVIGAVDYADALLEELARVR